MMALEGQETPDTFFDNGLQMLVDGADEEKLTVQLKKSLRQWLQDTKKTLVSHNLSRYCACNGNDRYISGTSCYAW